MRNAAIVRELYALAADTIESRRGYHFGIFTKYPGGILSSSVGLLRMLISQLGKLREFAALNASRFESTGFRNLFATLLSELSEEYLAGVQAHLRALEFDDGVLVSAELGDGNQGSSYVLREPRGKRPNWLKRMLGKGPAAYTFRVHPRDEVGARALGALRDRGINPVANAAAQSAEHILSFFVALKTELGFYAGCLNLRDQLELFGTPLCLPRPSLAAARTMEFKGLYDVCLALSMRARPVGNGLDASGKSLVIITGANQGGKSVFLRGVGLAQLMMQAGMFVGAESFAGNICKNVFTHYKREEDATMKQGKLDEELSRMSDIAAAISANATVLFNESFAATNEREGSEIARQVVSALVEKGVKVIFVTHLYQFAHGLWENRPDGSLFLRAQRLEDGTRTFKLLEAEPLQTSYGVDLYQKIFGQVSDDSSASM